MEEISSFLSPSLPYTWLVHRTRLLIILCYLFVWSMEFRYETRNVPMDSSLASKYSCRSTNACNDFVERNAEELQNLWTNTWQIAECEIINSTILCSEIEINVLLSIDQVIASYCRWIESPDNPLNALNKCKIILIFFFPLFVNSLSLSPPLSFSRKKENEMH